jgi:hypothetical protein
LKREKLMFRFVSRQKLLVGVAIVSSLAIGEVRAGIAFAAR